MNIGIIGIGGVGGYFGGKLAGLLKESKELKIFFVARGRHLEEIRKNGLTLDSDEGLFSYLPTLATDDISELPQLDLCLICVKSYDLADVLTRLEPKVGDMTMILPLLNGVDIYERIRGVIKKGIVFPSCVYVGTHIERPGKVKQRGGACTIHFGNDPARADVSPQLFELLERANIKFNWTENPYTEIWSKFIFIASFGMVTANFDKTVGEVLESEELSRHVKNIMTEIYRIAVKKGVSLPATIVDDAYMKGNKFPFETKTSFQRDYEKREKLDERDLFGGAVIRLGKELGLETKTTELLYSSLQENKPI